MNVCRISCYPHLLAEKLNYWIAALSSERSAVRSVKISQKGMKDTREMLGVHRNLCSCLCDGNHSSLLSLNSPAFAAPVSRCALHILRSEIHGLCTESFLTPRFCVSRLRDFFSNPGNFESVRDPSSSEGDVLGARLNRASSSQTLDSLDFHREPSDDDLHGRVDERVAVLEFELRKARDVIQNLREHLTSLTGSPEPANSTTPILPKTSQSASSLSEDVAVIQPLERRALNFLINEYLLTNEYKLTSITFTDECQNLDFDDWDDVGLNISKPPGLLSLYRRFRYGANIPVAAVEILFSSK